MVMEGFLPDRVGKSFGNYTFKLLYNGRDCRGDHWSPALPVLDQQQQMNVVRHDRIFFYRNVRIMGRNFKNALLYDFSRFG